MTSKALVGPLPVVRFHDGTKIVYQPPRDTSDGGRWRACRDHRTACDCREAEFAEQMAEHWIEHRAIRSKAAQLLAGHRLFDHGDVFTRGNRPETDDEELRWRYISGDGPLACQCTGCQVIRAGDVYLPTDEHGVVTADAAELSR